MILRELIAKFGLDFDAASFGKAHGAVESLKREAVALVGAFIGIQGIRLGFNVAREAAEFADALTIFEAAGNSLDEFRDKTKGLLSDKSLVTNFNLASQFGITKDQFFEFTKIADAAAKKLGKSQEFIFDSLISGTARLSKPILDNAGIILDTEKTVKDGAAKIGKSVESLSDREKRGIIAQGVLEQGKAIVASVAGVNATVSDVFDQWDSGWSNAKLALGQVALTVLKEFLPALIKIFNSIAKNKKQILAFATDAIARIKSVGASFLLLLDIIGGVQNALIVLGIAFGVQLVAQIGAAVAATGAFTLAQLAARAVALANAFIIGAGFIALAAIIFLLGEEISAAFDPNKLGLFEALQGKWGILSDRIRESIDLTNDTWYNSLLKIAGVVTTTVWDAFDKYFEFSFREIQFFIDLWNDALNVTTAIPDEWQQAFKPFFDWIDARIKNVTDFFEAVSNFDTGNAVAGLFDKGSLGDRIFSGDVRPSAAVAAASASNSASASSSVNVNVDASGQSLDETSLTDMIGRRIDEVIKWNNSITIQALTPSTAGQ